MKNIKPIVNPADIHDHVKSLWHLDMFRDSHEKGGFVFDIVDRFARLPRFFFDMSDERAERAHFSVWWSGVHYRSYDKPSCNDLYLLHELAHGADMIHAKGFSHEGFVRKMQDNEFSASVATEIMVYFALPELRQLTFPHEIYADRYLKDPLYQAKWRHDPQRLTSELYYRRREAMFNPAKGDKIEKWLSDFMPQNNTWHMIWKPKYALIENRMEDFAQEALAGRGEDALKRHIDWLLSDEIAKGGAVPFPEEAAAFAEIYWKNRESCPVTKAA